MTGQNLNIRLECPRIPMWLIAAIIVLAPVAMKAQFVSFAMGYSYNEVQAQLVPGGEFEGLRHATTEEMWFITEYYYGYDRLGTDADNAGPVFQLLVNDILPEAPEGLWTFGQPFPHSSAQAQVADGTVFTIWYGDNMYPVYGYEPGPQGRISEVGMVDPEFSEAHMGHFLVEDSSIIPVPEPAAVAIPGVAGLAALLALRIMAISGWRRAKR